MLKLASSRCGARAIRLRFYLATSPEAPEDKKEAGCDVEPERLAPEGIVGVRLQFDTLGHDPGKPYHRGQRWIIEYGPPADNPPDRYPE